MAADRWDEFLAAGGDDVAFLDKIDRPFRERVTGRNLRNRWLGRALIERFQRKPPGRGVALGHTLAKNLYRHRLVADLPQRPQVIFTSTDLTSGRAFRICRDFVGNFDYGYIEPTPASIELGTAVASSAAFPMALAVIWLPTPSLPRGDPPGVLSLHDGGVYDNMGLEWFQGWKHATRPDSAVKADFLIVINASGPRTPTKDLYGAVRALKRDMDIQYQQTLDLRVRWLIDEWLAKPGRGIYVGISRGPRGYRCEPKPGADEGEPISADLYEGALPAKLVDPLSRVRTDLDRFTPLEAELLSYHGYWSLHARLGMYFPELTTEPSWNIGRYAKMTEAETEAMRQLLVKSSKIRPWRRASN